MEDRAGLYRTGDRLPEAGACRPEYLVVSAMACGIRKAEETSVLQAVAEVVTRGYRTVRSARGPLYDSTPGPRELTARATLGGSGLTERERVPDKLRGSIGGRCQLSIRLTASVTVVLLQGDELVSQGRA